MSRTVLRIVNNRQSVRDIRQFVVKMPVPSLNTALVASLTDYAEHESQLLQMLPGFEMPDIGVEDFLMRSFSTSMNGENPISWCTHSFNLCKGCSECGRLCVNCWARILSELRLYYMPGQIDYYDAFRVSMLTRRLLAPLFQKKPCIIFCPSMGDLGHTEIQKPVTLPGSNITLPGGRIEPDYIVATFRMMAMAYWHIFMVLTKRPENFLRYLDRLQFPSNAWFGASAGSKSDLQMIRDLKRIPARVRFLSIEPLLGDFPELESELAGIDMVIIGGESYGQKVDPAVVERRQMRVEWALRIREMCQQNNVAFHFKQWGGRGERAPLLPDMPLAEYLKLRQSEPYAKLSEGQMINTILANPEEWNARKFYGYPEEGLPIMQYWKPEDYGQP